MDVNNQKILFLLDDTPYWLAASGNIPLLAIPFDLIEKVEVIRGPGSVIYGTNASAGVIKVVTRKDDNDNVSVMLGDHETARLSGYQLWEHTGNLKTTTRLGYEVQVSDGYKAWIENALTGQPGLSPTENGEISRSEESTSFYVSHRQNNFNGFLHASETRKSGASLGTIRSPSIFRENSLMLHGDYTFIKDNFNTNVFAEYNNYYSTTEIDNLLILWDIPGNGEFSYEDNGRENYRLRGGIQTKIKMSATHLVLLGAEHEKRSTGDYLLFDDNNGDNLNAVPVPGFSTTPGYTGVLIHGADESEENTVYAQSDSSINDFRFLLGVRYVDNSKSGSKVIPRLAAVYQLGKAQSLKLLYSVGFNSPTFRQNADVGSFGTSTNTDLKAETVRSYDLAYNYALDGSLFVANLFFIQARDIIDSANGVFVNSEDFERSGFELDYQLTRKSWLLYSNLSYLEQGNSIDIDDPSAAYAPQWNFSLGTRYSMSRAHQFGGSFRFISERINADSNSIVNLDYKFKQKIYSLYATLANVLNEDIVHPDVRSLGITDITIQAYPERTLFLGLEYRY
jgi:outer membrane receptor protein involved in Fe transport